MKEKSTNITISNEALELLNKMRTALGTNTYSETIIKIDAKGEQVAAALIRYADLVDTMDRALRQVK